MPFNIRVSSSCGRTLKCNALVSLCQKTFKVLTSRYWFVFYYAHSLLQSVVLHFYLMYKIVIYM